MQRREEKKKKKKKPGGPKLTPGAPPHSESLDCRKEVEGKRITRKCVDSLKARENYAEKNMARPGDGQETDEDED